MDIQLIGIDLAKTVFQVCGMNSTGKVVLRKRLKRANLLAFIANLPPSIIGIEACAGANYWARAMKSEGHEVKIMSPHFVKPYVKTNKNDFNDAEAICEAVSRPTMRFVSIKSVEQQDIQAIHRIREQLIKSRTALINQIRGLLSEYGIVLPKGASYVRRHIPVILEDAENGLTALFRQLLNERYELLAEYDVRIKQYDGHIQTVFNHNPDVKRLERIEGVGPTIATAFVAAVGDAKLFKMVARSPPG